MSDINRVVLTGTIAEPRLGYLESGKPELRLSLTVDQENPFKLYVQVFCYGSRAEPLAERLEAGDRVLIDGRLSWRSTVKAGVKEGKMVVTCYDVEVLSAWLESPQDERSDGDATPESSVPGENHPEPKARWRGYPKAALSATLVTVDSVG
jgi:single-stranded DNA-binding protein